MFKKNIFNVYEFQFVRILFPYQHLPNFPVKQKNCLQIAKKLTNPYEPCFFLRTQINWYLKPHQHSGTVENVRRGQIVAHPQPAGASVEISAHPHFTHISIENGKIGVK
jgi:hypothetical protein